MINQGKNYIFLYDKKIDNIKVLDFKKIKKQMKWIQMFNIWKKLKQKLKNYFYKIEDIDQNSWRVKGSNRWGNYFILK